MYTKHTFQLCL